MKNTWTSNWKKAFIWFGAYFSFIALAIVGGYTIVKSEDENLKKTTKKAFVITLIFAALSALVSIVCTIGGFSVKFYGSTAYDICNILNVLISIAKIVVFAVFLIMDLVKKDSDDVQDDNNDQNNGDIDYTVY